MSASKTSHTTTHHTKKSTQGTDQGATPPPDPAGPQPSASPASPAAAASPAVPAASPAAPPPASPIDLVDLPLAQIQAAAQQAITALGTIRTLLANPTRLTVEDRKAINGRLRDGESAVLQTVADVAQNPAYAPLLDSLSDRDFGLDPNAFEVAMLKDRLQKVDALQPLADALTGMAEDFSDTVLDLQSLARPPLLEAYAILKVVAKTNATLKAQLKDVIDFYAAAAQAGAKTKKAKAAAAAPPAAPAAAATPAAPAPPKG